MTGVGQRCILDVKSAIFYWQVDGQDEGTDKITWTDKIAGGRTRSYEGTDKIHMQFCAYFDERSFYEIVQSCAITLI